MYKTRNIQYIYAYQAHIYASVAKLQSKRMYFAGDERKGGFLREEFLWVKRHMKVNCFYKEI